MWLSLWSTARYDLHLNSDEFFSLTPRKFDALVKRHRSKNEMNEFMLAQLTALVANTSFKSFDEPKKTTDYMPSQWAKANKTTISAKPQSPEDNRASVENFFRGLFINGKQSG